MINIDWSYAPSGATHFHKGDIMYRPHWRKSGFYCDLGLEAFGWIKDTYPSPISECIERPKKQEAWDGVGLPPVNCFCETLDEDADCWVKVEIYAHTEFMGETHACAKNGTDMFYGLAREFRPIKTAEQLADEEKVEAIAEMRAVVIAASDRKRATIAECTATVALYEAGYRKQ